MLIFDQLKRNDPQLRLLTTVMLAGLFVLLTGLWWVQVVRAGYYQGHLESQSLRTIRVPASRGKILDRNGEVLAENRPSYSVSLYLEDLRSAFDKVYTNASANFRSYRAGLIIAEEKRLGRKLSKQERKAFAMTIAERDQLRQYARYSVASNVVFEISQRLGRPTSVEPAQFNRHYATALAMPYTVLGNLDPVQIARFEEQLSGSVGADLEIQNIRSYPNGTTAAHVLGYLQRDDSSKWGEEAYFSYRLPDYRGVIGAEGYFDPQLRGHAGAKSVLVNNLGYRQNETIWEEARPGSNVVLTIDRRIQQAAEQSLARHQGIEARGAIVVMDVNTGDVLAMVSSPVYDPNDFANGISEEKYRRLQELTAEKNRATHENYAPGSIFKTVVALAALENGLNPEEIFRVQANPENPQRGIFYVGRRGIKDTAPPGDYNFKKAFIHSSNSYFITNGMRAGIENIIRISQKLHLGERTELLPRQDATGNLPTIKRVRSGWSPGETANVCIGQGQIVVTPVQMAVLTAAIANGGKVLWPRLVDRIEPQDPLSPMQPVVSESGRVRDELGVRPRTLRILQDAMLADVEEPGGTGTPAAVPGLRICGKTGTAQVQDAKNRLTGWNYWFASFAPYEKPKYAVVVMIESTSSGSGTIVCAPIAHDIYVAIQKLKIPAGIQTMAQNN